MTNTIKIKRGVGKPDSLEAGELAIDTDTGALYSLVGSVVTEINEPPEGVDLSKYIDSTKKNDVVEGSFQIVWDDSADADFPFNGRIGYNKNSNDPNSLDGSFLYVNGNRGTFSIGRDGDVELHGPSEILGIADRLTSERPWITGFSYVQAADFLDADGNSIVGGGGASDWASITGKPTEFTPEAHTHEISEVNGLKSELNLKLNIDQQVWKYYPDEYRFVSLGFGGYTRGEFWALSVEPLSNLAGELSRLEETVMVDKLEATDIFGPYLKITAPNIEIGIDGQDDPGSLVAKAPAYFRNAFSVEHTILGGLNITAADADRPDELPYGADEKSVQYALSVTHQTLGRTVEIDKDGTIRARAFTDMDGNAIGGGGSLPDADVQGSILVCQSGGWEASQNFIVDDDCDFELRMTHGELTYSRAEYGVDPEYPWSEHEPFFLLHGVNDQVVIGDLKYSPHIEIRAGVDPDEDRRARVTVEGTITADDYLDADGNSIVGTGGGGGDVDLSEYYTKTESDGKYQVQGNYAVVGASYTKAESDTKWQPKGSYQPAGNYAASNHNHSGVYQPAGSYAASNHNHSGVYAPASHSHSYAAVGASYTKAESDAKYELKGAGGGGDFVPLSGNSTIAGTLTATDFVATSDVRLKRNIIDAPLGVIEQLNGREWEWNKTGAKGSGVIAQELEQVLPHLVNEDSEGMKAVSYSGLTAYLIEAVKELSARVKDLEGSK